MKSDELFCNDWLLVVVTQNIYWTINWHTKGLSLISQSPQEQWLFRSNDQQTFLCLPLNIPAHCYYWCIIDEYNNPWVWSIIQFVPYMVIDYQCKLSISWGTLKGFVEYLAWQFLTYIWVEVIPLTQILSHFLTKGIYNMTKRKEGKTYCLNGSLLWNNKHNQWVFRGFD